MLLSKDIDEYDTPEFLHLSFLETMIRRMLNPTIEKLANFVNMLQKIH